MQLQHYPLKKLKTELLSSVTAEVGGTSFSLFFFGSRVKGNADEHADIDVGYLAAQKLSISLKAKIKDRIDNIHTLYKIDFVDFGNVDEQFRNLAMRNTETIYE